MANEALKIVEKPYLDETPNIVFLKFADSKIPVFKETRSKDYIQYGDKNAYPEYLTYLYSKSAKHGAIINGKSLYIFGEGFENGDFVVNRLDETLNDLSRKAIKDIELYGGFRFEIIWNRAGKVAEVYHADYNTIRKAKDCGYYYKASWDINNRDEEKFIEEFDPSNPVGSQIFAYDEYRPGFRYYPLPSYIACANYIETDIEISKFNLSIIRNGMAPSKAFQFFNGDPGEEKKRQMERKLNEKFGGSERAGTAVMIFNNSKDQEVKIDDLSGSDNDKMYIELNKSVQQEIFSGHLITSPMLFGIMEPGKLGGATELKTAYEIFINTYAKPKATAYDREIGYLMQYSIWPGAYELQPTDPINVQIDVKDVIAQLPTEFILDKIGVPKDQRGGATGAGPAPSAAQAPETMANDNIRNLTAKQHQQVMRIIRQYSKGQLTEVAAKAMLRVGYGLDESDINDLLGIENVQMSAQPYSEDAIIGMFDACGHDRDDFEVLRSKRVNFSLDSDDEQVFIDSFKTYDITRTEDRIIQLISKDKRITPKVIAEIIGQTEAYVNSRIESLVKRGYIEEASGYIGTDEIIERTIPDIQDIITPPPISGSTPPTQIFVKYSYEGPVDNRNRPFCAKLMSLKRLYSRAEIESISTRLGYSVFDRRGGFWTHHDGTVTPYCRHTWKSNIVVKKGGVR
jgi:DNA-binding Lrp family transcriptional regulator